MASPDIVTLTDADFENQVKAHPRLLVDFWAEWCGPCRMIAPVLEELAGEYKNRLTIGKVNVDENRRHCGSCYQACSPYQTCVLGTCL